MPSHTYLVIVCVFLCAVTTAEETATEEATGAGVSSPATGKVVNGTTPIHTTRVVRGFTPINTTAEVVKDTPTETRTGEDVVRGRTTTESLTDEETVRNSTAETSIGEEVVKDTAAETGWEVFRSQAKGRVVPSKNQVCLDHIGCYRESYLDHGHMEIHHYDHTTRTASSCLPVCLQGRPATSTQLVMVKVIPMNERLVCGCGGEAALGNRTGVVDDTQQCDFCPDATKECVTCPEQYEKCGGQKTISVYRVRYGDECRETTTTTTTTTTTRIVQDPEPQKKVKQKKVTFAGCFKESSMTDSQLRPQFYLPRKGTGGDEVTRCLDICALERPHALLFLQIVEEGVFFCGCGSSDALQSSAALSEDACGYLGSRTTYAVYTGGTSCPLPPAPISLLFLMMAMMKML